MYGRIPQKGKEWSWSSQFFLFILWVFAVLVHSSIGARNFGENCWRFRTKFVRDPSLSWANTACWKLGKSVCYVTRLSFTADLEKRAFCVPEWDLGKEILSWSNAAAAVVCIQVWCKSSPLFCSVPFYPKREPLLVTFFQRTGLWFDLSNYKWLKKNNKKTPPKHMFWNIVMKHINSLKILKWWICVVRASCRVLITGVC